MILYCQSRETPQSTMIQSTMIAARIPRWLVMLLVAPLLFFGTDEAAAQVFTPLDAPSEDAMLFKTSIGCECVASLHVYSGAIAGLHGDFLGLTQPTANTFSRAQHVRFHSGVFPDARDLIGTRQSGESRDDGRSAAFLLIIPGSAAIGFGTGLASENPAPGLIIGAGAGALVWGLIVALR